MQKLMKSVPVLFLAAVMLAVFSGCGDDPAPPPEPGKGGPTGATGEYNAKFRAFPNAPAPGTVTYEWFEANARVKHWNDQGHNHRYPDIFRFMDGTPVGSIADFEKRQKEISLMLQYYMHGRMPSIDPSVLQIDWADSGNTCTIDLTHIESGRTAQFEVTHNPPAGTANDAKNKVLLFNVGSIGGFGGAPTSPRGDWGTALFNIAWGGSEGGGANPPARSGTCATLYDLQVNAPDTPSVNMEYAWAMSVILTVIKGGGLNGYYNPDRVGIYGFSRWGKAAMIIGAFAEGREGNKIGQTFIGSAGSGGPAVDRWIAQMGYKNFEEDPLPADTAADGIGINSFNDLKGTTWYLNLLSTVGGQKDMEVVRGWDAATPGIPEDSHIYGEYDPANGGFTRNPGPPEDWGRIQVLSQARSEIAGWFSRRFGEFTVNHSSARLDIGSGGVLCTMPFDAHFISALIAPRIVLYEDGFNTVRNNPEGQWANWLMCDEIYQMYAEELNDPSYIWRNAIKFYDIGHVHYAFQDQDEYDLTTAIYNGTQPNVKFRTPPFPVDDPRYRWDFDRMDIGRPGHPTIAQRVWDMRHHPAKVKAMDWRGLLDDPDEL